jgi:hypothetical protein
MPTNRFQFSDDFTLNNGNVGINSATPQTKLDVVGVVRGESLKVTGVSTFTTYEGFLNSNQNIVENTTISGGGISGSLSGEIIVGTGITVTVASGTTSSQGNIDSLKVYNTFTVPVGGTADRPSKATPGQLFFNRDFATMEFWDGDRWRQVDNTTQRGRGVFGGFESPGTSIIDYVNIASTGNAINFGTMDSNQGQRGSGCSSSIRGLFMGGSSPTGNNVINYITLTSESNGIDFGDLTSTNVFHNACCASSTRGLNGGGTPGAINVIDYVQISTIGNALDFGDLSVGRERFSALSSSTRGIWGGGYNAGSGGPALSILDFVIIASKGNAVSFGSLDRQMDAGASCANSVRGLWAGGTSKSAGANWNLISYITLSSSGTAIYFGDLTGVGTVSPGSLASQTRGIFAGGGNPTVNNISYVQISTTGNSQDFGDLTNARRFIAGCSDSHGGLGGF